MWRRQALVIQHKVVRHRSNKRQRGQTPYEHRVHHLLRLLNRTNSIQNTKCSSNSSSRNSHHNQVKYKWVTNEENIHIVASPTIIQSSLLWPPVGRATDCHMYNMILSTENVTDNIVFLISRRTAIAFPISTASATGNLFAESQRCLNAKSKW